MGWADALPTVGYWKVGDKLTVGAADYVCTVEGSPGTWRLAGGIVADGIVRLNSTDELFSAKGNISHIVKLEVGVVQIVFKTPYLSPYDYSVLLTVDREAATANLDGRSSESVTIAMIDSTGASYDGGVFVAVFGLV